MKQFALCSLLLLGAARVLCSEPTPPAVAVPTADIVKVLLNQAAASAVSTLGRADGFMGDSEVRIPLPGKLQKASKTLRKLGASKQTDALQLAMNRAAEAAMPEAREVLLDAIRQLDIADAAAIVSGPANAATEYFRRTMSDQLAEKLLPVVDRTTADVQLARQYEAVTAKASALGVLDDKDISLEGYVSRKALDGLFVMMAREEAAIRSNPQGQIESLRQQVFGTTATQ